MRQTRLQVPGLLLRAVSVAAFVLLWKWAVDVNIHWPLQFGNLPDPIDILAEWYRNLFTPQYRQDIAISTSRVLTGIALGFTTAVPLGLWIGLKRTANHTLYTNLELFRPIPLIAYLPVAMLLFRTIESSIIFYYLHRCFLSHPDQLAGCSEACFPGAGASRPLPGLRSGPGRLERIFACDGT